MITRRHESGHCLFSASSLTLGMAPQQKRDLSTKVRVYLATSIFETVVVLNSPMD